MWSRLFVLLFLLALLTGQSRPGYAQEIRMAILAKPGSPQYTVAAKFKELVEADPSGQWHVALDPIGVSRNETEAIEQIRVGTVHLGIFAASAFEQLNPIVRVLSYPFLFANETEADAILDGPLGATILRDLETIACKGLGFTEIGFRHLTNSVRSIQTIDDLKGLRIRVTTAPIHTALWLSLGANPVPKPWPIYSELEQGGLEAQENPLRVIETYNFFEVQKYLTLTRHSYAAAINIASLKWWHSLPPSDQEKLLAAMRTATLFQRAGQRARDAATLMVLKGKGMHVEPSPDLAPFRARTTRLKEMPVYREPRIQVLLTKIQETIPLLPPPTSAVATRQEPHPPVQPESPAAQSSADGVASDVPSPSTGGPYPPATAPPVTVESITPPQDTEELPQPGNLASEPLDAPAEASADNPPQVTEEQAPAAASEAVNLPQPTGTSDEHPSTAPQFEQPAPKRDTAP